MLHYDRIDVSKGIYINKTKASKDRNVCRNWCFLDKEFQPNVCIGCHNVLTMVLIIMVLIVTVLSQELLKVEQ